MSDQPAAPTSVALLPQHPADGFTADPLGVLQEGHRRHGPVFRMPVDGVDTVLVGTWAGLGELFAAERGRLDVLNTPLVHDLFGRALFNLTADGHGEARRRLRPALSGRALPGYVPSLLDVIGPATEQWALHGTADLHGQVRELTGAMSARVLLGITPGETDAAQFAAAFEEFVAATGAPPGPARYADRRYWAGRSARRELHALFARRAAQLCGDAAGGSALAGLVAAFADAPHEAGPLADHLLALLIAARETTASLLIWCLVELAGNRQDAEYAAAEARTVAADPDRLVARDALPALRSVLAETLRLHAPNLLSIRKAVCPFTLAGHRIEAGTRVAYSPSAGHFDPEAFLRPGQFRPGRFLSGQASASRLWAFGGGAHACLGRPLAELMVLAVMAAALQRGIPHLPAGPPARISFRPAKAPIDPLPFALESLS
ncbi:cytochrome P450 [Streptomyces lavenduligriseus]|uniref:Cytochrome P450 n=1 Tax=Streptomyces lavenduligriseus TaxID=67315 RepID=A0ABT0P5B8_9ACTN|nr:cytochrome P450 [Streptomyces lavenduligriseus]MCL3998766.1 cytochrome P450 [Streptomyces lavenduligriseus]